MPWLVRLLLAAAAFIRLLGKYIWRLARKNIPLSLGLALFFLVFTITAYNAFFRQSSVSRPILFSTRGDAILADTPGNQPNRPFVAKAISTGAQANGAKAAGAAAYAAPKSAHDAIADFIARQGKGAAPGRAPPALPH